LKDKDVTNRVIKKKDKKTIEDAIEGINDLKKDMMYSTFVLIILYILGLFLLLISISFN